MDRKYIINLLGSAMIMVSTASYAERPAAEDSAPASSEAATMAEDDMRPAAEVAAEPATTVRTETQTTGDVMTMPESVEAQPQAVRKLDFPRRGMSQDKVQNELGRPLEIVPAVGQPPITRWVYNDRVVYFEYSSVIHVVAK